MRSRGGQRAHSVKQTALRSSWDILNLAEVLEPVEFLRRTSTGLCSSVGLGLFAMVRSRLTATSVVAPLLDAPLTGRAVRR
jgi:hypothetical protein